MVTLQDAAICQHAGCTNTATVVAFGYEEQFEAKTILGVFCEPHADKLVDVSHPEYVITCANCGYLQGVN